MFATVFEGRVMYEIGVETVGQGALKLTGFLKELMHQRNISYESLYTVRTIKEVKFVYDTIVEVIWCSGIRPIICSDGYTQDNCVWSLLPIEYQFKHHCHRMEMISDICPYLSLSYMKKLCYVAADYEAELRKDTQASCEVDGEGWFTLSTERFKTAEILFQPHMGGMYVIFRYRLIRTSITVVIAQC